MEQIIEAAKKESKTIHALVRLLYNGALRIQDAVGLTFGDITRLKPNKDGFRILKLVAKKSSSRLIPIG